MQQRGGSTNGEHAGTGGDGGGGGGRPGIVRRLATCFFYLFVAVLVLDFMAISYLDGVDEYFMIWKDAWDTAEDAPRMMTGVYLPTVRGARGARRRAFFGGKESAVVTLGGATVSCLRLDAYGWVPFCTMNALSLITTTYVDATVHRYGYIWMSGF